VQRIVDGGDHVGIADARDLGVKPGAGAELGERVELTPGAGHARGRIAHPVQAVQPRRHHHALTTARASTVQSATTRSRAVAVELVCPGIGFSGPSFARSCDRAAAVLTAIGRARGVRGCRRGSPRWS
jgi:hypothetical protein